MTLKDLHVIHIYAYNSPKERHCPLKTFKNRVLPLTISTCMRHIYLFSSQQMQLGQVFINTLESYVNHPGKHQKRCHYEHLTGANAYAFLLYWSIGGLNQKHRFADQRILGDLRKSLYNYEHSASKNAAFAWKENKGIAIALRRDSKYLNEWNNTLPSGNLSEKKDLLFHACQRCSWARTNGVLSIINAFNYQEFANDSQMLQHILEKLDILEQKYDREKANIRERLSTPTLTASESIKGIDKRLCSILQLRALVVDRQNVNEHALDDIKTH